MCGGGGGGGGGSGSAWFRFLSLKMSQLQVGSDFSHKNVTASGGVGSASPADPALLLHYQILFFQT